MPEASDFLLCLWTLLVFCSYSESEKGGSKTQEMPKDGAICNPKKDSPLMIGDDPHFYMECLQPRDEEWKWENLGEWTYLQCPEGQIFSQKVGNCREKKTIRRTMGGYEMMTGNMGQGQTGQSMVFGPTGDYGTGVPVDSGGGVPGPDGSLVWPPKPCPRASGQKVAGGICSWMMERLEANPGNPMTYLQCVPAKRALACGRYRVMRCAEDTLFSVQVQTCVFKEDPEPLKPSGGTHVGGQGAGSNYMGSTGQGQYSTGSIGSAMGMMTGQGMRKVGPAPIRPTGQGSIPDGSGSNTQEEVMNTEDVSPGAQVVMLTGETSRPGPAQFNDGLVRYAQIDGF